MNEGWKCPNCGKAHAPHIETCPEQSTYAPYDPVDRDVMTDWTSPFIHPVPTWPYVTPHPSWFYTTCGSAGDDDCTRTTTWNGQ